MKWIDDWLDGPDPYPVALAKRIFTVVAPLTVAFFVLCLLLWPNLVPYVGMALIALFITWLVL